MNDKFNAREEPKIIEAIDAPAKARRMRPLDVDSAADPLRASAPRGSGVDDGWTVPKPVMSLSG